MGLGVRVQGFTRQLFAPWEMTSCLSPKLRHIRKVGSEGTRFRSRFRSGCGLGGLFCTLLLFRCAQNSLPEQQCTEQPTIAARFSLHGAINRPGGDVDRGQWGSGKQAATRCALRRTGTATCDGASGAVSTLPTSRSARTSTAARAQPAMSWLRILQQHSPRTARHRVEEPLCERAPLPCRCQRPSFSWTDAKDSRERG